MAAAEEFLETLLKVIVEEVFPEQISNGDETSPSERILVHKETKLMLGFEVPKDRIAVLLEGQCGRL
jgi:hypothetical protein